jgi:hypothetical protein
MQIRRVAEIARVLEKDHTSSKPIAKLQIWALKESQTLIKV